MKQVLGFLIIIFFGYFSYGQERPLRFTDSDYLGGIKEFKRMVSNEVFFEPYVFEKSNGVKIRFELVIDEEGKVYSKKLLGGFSEVFEQEAIRLLNKTEFKPAHYEGEALPSNKIVTFNFKKGAYKLKIKRRGYAKPINLDSSNEIIPLNQLSSTPKPKLAQFKNLDELVRLRIEFPSYAYKNDISGKTTISFIVEPSGNSSNIYPIKYLGGGCSESLMKVLRELLWIPGMIDGKAVRTRIEYTMNFKIQKDGYQYEPISNQFMRQ